MNTAFDYRYRDACNYKFPGTVVFSGVLPEGNTFPLDDGDGDFIAVQIGIPNEFPWESGEFKYDPDDDGAYHEFCGLRQTDEEPTDPRSIEDFLKEVVAAVEAGWNEELVKFP